MEIETEISVGGHVAGQREGHVESEREGHMEETQRVKDRVKDRVTLAGHIQVVKDMTWSHTQVVKDMTWSHTQVVKDMKWTADGQKICIVYQV